MAGRPVVAGTPSLSPYPQINGYTISALLGRGGMATVYAATQLAVEREVAIKVVDLDDEEAHSLARLRHPNIVGLYEYGRTAEGLPYYVMPLLEGGDLSAWPRPVAEQKVLALLDKLLDALGHAHAAGIIHRDIKPENILFDGEGRPMLADFGAALRPNHSRLTETGLAIGSVGYMSPEQARGLAVDARSDLYSLALVAYELLAGRPPFDGPDALAVALAQLEGPPPQLPPPLRDWQRFFERALAANPAQRYPDAASMRAALGELGTRVASATPAGKRLLRPVAAWLLAGALVGALPLLWWQGQPDFDPAEVERLIGAGSLLPPQTPNALDQLLAVEPPRPAEWEALRLRLLAAAAEPIGAALDSADQAVLLEQLPRWRTLVDQLDAGRLAPVQALEARVADAIRIQFEDALIAFDRGAAEAALQLYGQLGAPDAPLSELRERVLALPDEGERYVDAAGVELVLLRRPGPQQKGLAIMAAAVDPELYARFVRERGRAARPCPQAPVGVQGCLGRQDAAALAGWLSEASGQRYRLPSRDELLAHADRVTASGAKAWSETCVQVTTVRDPNVAQRAWGGVKSVFGGRKAEAKVERSCQGYYAIELAGASPVATAQGGVDARTTVVLMSEIALP
jgi:hypothetical protein